jgi:hypothetical protein
MSMFSFIALNGAYVIFYLQNIKLKIALETVAEIGIIALLAV